MSLSPATQRPLESLSPSPRTEEIQTGRNLLALYNNLAVDDVPLTDDPAEALAWMNANQAKLDEIKALFLENVTHIPPVIGKLKNLEMLTFKNLKITSFPQEMANLKVLSEIFCINATLPADSSVLKKCTIVHLDALPKSQWSPNVKEFMEVTVKMAKARAASISASVKRNLASAFAAPQIPQKTTLTIN